MLSTQPHTHTPPTANVSRQPCLLQFWFWPKTVMKTLSNRNAKQTNKKRTNERSQINQRKQKHSTCSARLTEARERERGSATDGSPGRAAVKNVIKEIQIKGVQRAWTRSEPSKPHISKEVNFRRTLWKETIGTGNQIFTINLDNFVN